MPRPKVWDGRGWVTHGGVIYKGEREVIEYEGYDSNTRPSRLYRGGNGAGILGVTAACGSTSHTIRIWWDSNTGWVKRIGPEKRWNKEWNRCYVLTECMRMRHCPMDNLGKSYKEGLSKGCQSCSQPRQIPLWLDRRLTAAKQRCENPNDPGYHNYGERGIRFDSSGSDRRGDLSNRKIWASRQKNGDRQDRQQWELCSGQYPFL